MKTIKVKNLTINVCNGDEFEEILAEKGFPSFLEKKSPLHTWSYDATCNKEEMEEILAKRRISNEDEDSSVFCLGYYHREEGKTVCETYFDIDANKEMALRRAQEFLAEKYEYDYNAPYRWARRKFESIGLL